MGLIMKKYIFLIILITSLLIACLGFYSILKGDIEDIVICSVNGESHYIPSNLCEYYLLNYRVTREDIKYLESRSGIAFLFGIPNKDKRNKLLRYFISKGVSIDNPSAIDGYPPLHAAIIYNDRWLVKFLLENGANSKQKDNNHKLAPKEFVEFLNHENPSIDRSEILSLLTASL